MSQTSPAQEAVRAALEATFTARAYDRSLRQTIWSRVWTWLGERLDDILRAAERAPGVGWAVLGALGLIVLAVVLRALYVAARRRDAADERPPGVRAGAGMGDPWHAAIALAGAGDFGAAAHALYAALLGRLAQRERLARHPSKTAGDYARDLRALRSRSHAPFRQFTREYDRVVYGAGSCDADQFARLLDAANGVAAIAGDGGGARRG